MSTNGVLGVIALVPDRWDGIVGVRHQVLQRLARRHPVVWVEPAAEWREFLRPSSGRFLHRDRWTTPSAGIEIFTSGMRHPMLYRPARLGRAMLRSRLGSARKRLVERGASRIALYLWRHEFADALELVEHDFSCYHIDDEYSFSDDDVPTPERELAVLRRVNQVIVHSRTLLAKKGHVNPSTKLIPNGVDFRSFSTPQAEPKDIASIPHPRIGYAGVIKRQLDLGLLVRLARARPNWSLVLVGPITNVAGKEAELEALRKIDNVHFLGRKTAAELPAYVQSFDVCLLCYDMTGYTHYIYPLKLHEYLASGRPAVASPINSLREFADSVSLAGNDTEWLAAIASALSQPAREHAAADARRGVARAHDWDTLVDQIAAVFDDA